MKKQLRQPIFHDLPQQKETVSGHLARDVSPISLWAAVLFLVATLVLARSIDAQVPPQSPSSPIEIIPTPVGVPEGADSEAPKTKPIPITDLNSSDPKMIASAPETANPKDANAKDVTPDPSDIQKTPLGPEDYRDWVTPDLTLVISGNQHGYIEPCGCTGLANQKGGVARRASFIDELTKKGWVVAPIDAGNQVRRFGRQAEIKFARTAEAFKKMDYQAVALGPDDVRLGVGELVAVAATMDDPADALYVSANVVLLDPTLMPISKVFEKGGMKIGVTSVLDPESMETKPGDEVEVKPIIAAAKAALEELNRQSPDFRLLTFFGTEEAAKNLVREVQGFDVVVVAGGYGEPTYQAQAIEGTETKMILTGAKGMYTGLVGLYKNQSMKYCRVPLTDDFEDAPAMRTLMADYQAQLRDLGFESLGLRPIPHTSGRKFVGSEKCGECHKKAFEVWETSPHVDATESLVNPGERSDVSRHFDPECVSCHVTGWNPQGYYPYVSGYLSLEKTPHLTGNGCEGCHGPGAEHSAAEVAGASVNAADRDQLREAMKLPLSKAKEKCMECHDLDNSPDFHHEGAFEDDYWPQVEHMGKD